METGYIGKRCSRRQHTPAKQTILLRSCPNPKPTWDTQSCFAWQVFGLGCHPLSHSLPRIQASGSRPISRNVNSVVPHRGGTVPDSHRIPFSFTVVVKPSEHIKLWGYYITALLFSQLPS
ncbi:hypothetical protein Alches_23750 [Alicyclobacillus hesperidum subsp. aegles]|nr:hypothetical protein Alches_23750 [Alicyclobacillus hesperidum subsp. aegles]